MGSILLLVKTILGNRTLLVGSAFALIVSSFYLYYSHASSKIANLISETVTLSRLVEQKDRIIISLKQDYESVLAAKEQLTNVVSTSASEIEELRKKLFRENSGKKSLGVLATHKPGLVETRVNNATEQVFHCFEVLSEGREC